MKKEGIWVLEHEHERRHQAYKDKGLRSENIEDLKMEIAERKRIFNDLKVNYLVNYLRPEDEE